MGKNFFCHLPNFLFIYNSKKGNENAFGFFSPILGWKPKRRCITSGSEKAQGKCSHPSHFSISCPRALCTPRIFSWPAYKSFIVFTCTKRKGNFCIYTLNEELLSSNPKNKFFHYKRFFTKRQKTNSKQH